MPKLYIIHFSILLLSSYCIYKNFMFWCTIGEVNYVFCIKLTRGWWSDFNTDFWLQSSHLSLCLNSTFHLPRPTVIVTSKRYLKIACYSLNLFGGVLIIFRRKASCLGLPSMAALQHHHNNYNYIIIQTQPHRQ